MSGPTEDVYEAATLALDTAGGWNRPVTAVRAAVDSAYTAGVAAGRAQAAAGGLSCHLCDWPRPIDLDRHWHATHLAEGGDPR